jgi:hypothetical protein
MPGSHSSSHGRFFTVWRLYYKKRALPLGRVKLRADPRTKISRVLGEEK